VRTSAISVSLQGLEEQPHRGLPDGRAVGLADDAGEGTVALAPDPQDARRRLVHDAGGRQLETRLELAKGLFRSAPETTFVPLRRWNVDAQQIQPAMDDGDRFADAAW
jgi:hypothetical protein